MAILSCHVSIKLPPKISDGQNIAIVTYDLQLRPAVIVGSTIALRDREVRSSLTIHVCFLRETVFVGTNHPNMEETGSLENPIPSGKCYLD